MLKVPYMALWWRVMDKQTQPYVIHTPFHCYPCKYIFELLNALYVVLTTY